MRLTESEYAVLANRMKSEAQVTDNCAVGKRPKYRNKRCIYDGRKFDSQRERDYYIRLEREKAAKMIRGFAHQVTIPLPSGKRRMRLDFMVNTLDDRIRWLDAKGFETKDWLVKRDELEHSLGIKIECV